ncbi:NitT/TauT family transport system permease protein [Halogeometricum rufum]|uniref:NitT/TauT family transport system permease protein n=1 Tax=Halogeometricum rufum TaxID=553469 RepID=A0A1I6GXF1_9EURY|nr:ABC transporter permease [Halogeometricum rufum]SFR46858.1 NitT/TauT family transport system permease protein [Halogeometricum rufum]
MGANSALSAFDTEVDLPVTGSVPLGRLALRLLSVSAFVGLWWLLVNYSVSVIGLNFGLISGPVATGGALLNYLAGEPMTAGGQTIYIHILYSTWRVAAGVGIATVLAVTLGLLIGTSQQWEDYVYPAVELFRPIPPVAWVPIAILVFPTLSVTALSVNLAVLFVVFVGAFFPILVNTIEGVRNVEEEYSRAAESLGADRTDVFRHVILPATLPAILTGISLGIGLGWITVVAAEIVAGNYGIGYVTYQAYRLLATDVILVGMITIGALGYASSWLVVQAANHLTPWGNIETNR